VCLGIGKLSSGGELDNRYFFNGCLIVLIGVLGTSGVVNLVMHLMPFGIYLSMLLFYPFCLLINWIKQIQSQLRLENKNEITLFLSIVAIAFILWLFLLGIGVKIYERVN
jgi:hypothetical protein